MRRLRLVLAYATVVGAALLPAAAAAGGVTGPAFYVDGVLYRTVGTETDFADTGAPDGSFDTIYNFFGAQQYNVATAAPGDSGFNGGRWRVHGVAFHTSRAATVAAHDADGSGDLNTTLEVRAALADPGPAGASDTGVVRQFECPVIRLAAER